MLLDKIKDNLIGRQVAFFGYFSHDRFIRKVIIIVMIMPQVEKPVPLEPERLMNLKIKADCFFCWCTHAIILFMPNDSFIYIFYMPGPIIPFQPYNLFFSVPDEHTGESRVIQNAINCISHSINIPEICLHSMGKNLSHS